MPDMSSSQRFNPYAEIIIAAARRRGVDVCRIDAEIGLFSLRYKDRVIRCHESLSELTSAVASSICDDKALTLRTVSAVGIATPDQTEADVPRERLLEFLARHRSVVVKPARGEQGRGVAVGIDTVLDLDEAIARASGSIGKVLVEQCVSGIDLRVVVIDFDVVAAAVRSPPRVVGDGVSTVRTLVQQESRRRAQATQGESLIPIDAETARCARAAGYLLDDVLPNGIEILVRRTANLHTGGTITDVTSQLHPALAEVAISAARAIDIPVTGIDLIVTSPTLPRYVFIEANQRPGLANHEPQPTAERFIDFLFPLSVGGLSIGGS